MASKIEKAFRSLRRIGFIAEHSYMCCSDCAWTGIQNRFTKEPDLIGAVFYHSQDNEKKKAGRDFFVSFGYPGTLPPAHDLLAGHVVHETLLRFGIKAEWDGDVDNRIRIKADSWR